MLDKDNYPDEASLKTIEKWDILKKGVGGLLNLIFENTNWPDRQISITGRRIIRFAYHTGGWSGNEDVIGALHRNFLFWSLFWEKSTRGGHYYFKLTQER